MMKKLFLLTLTVLTFGFASAQDMTLEEMKVSKAEMTATIDASKAIIDATQADLDALQKKINMLSGWMTGLTGIVGLNFGGSNQWVANPNPTSSSRAISIGVTGYANREAEKYFWNNKLILNKAWQRVDITEADQNRTGNLFDFGTVDILNISSLAGYKLTEKFGITALAELNTSLGNFLEPGTFDIGVGGTWEPIPNLVVVIHPLNYRIAWSADGDTDSAGSIGAKIRADYQDDFMIAGRKIAWSSTFTTFLPYNSDKNMVPALSKFGVPETTLVDNVPVAVNREAGLFEYTWLNTFSFQVWKGIGVGATFGIRDAEFEFEDLQTFYTIGLTYTL